MIHHHHHLFVDTLDRSATIVTPIIGFIIAQLPSSGGLPGWLNGTIAGGVILVLVALLRFAITLWQKKDDEVRQMNLKQIQELRGENARLQAEVQRLHYKHEAEER